MEIDELKNNNKLKWDNTFDILALTFCLTLNVYIQILQNGIKLFKQICITSTTHYFHNQSLKRKYAVDIKMSLASEDQSISINLENQSNEEIPVVQMVAKIIWDAVIEFGILLIIMPAKNNLGNMKGFRACLLRELSMPVKEKSIQVNKKDKESKDLNLQSLV
ncbi:hypothetical protein C1646_771438 [Rhizophagus diaphanus]|nr:hypothetical protein C1646_771438 [Rhizophagus diaphanus] [Rhizophagus sp. MUCL 43196]